MSCTVSVPGTRVGCKPYRKLISQEIRITGVALFTSVKHYG